MSDLRSGAEYVEAELVDSGPEEHGAATEGGEVLDELAASPSVESGDPLARP